MNCNPCYVCFYKYTGCCVGVPALNTLNVFYWDKKRDALFSAPLFINSCESDLVTVAGEIPTTATTAATATRAIFARTSLVYAEVASVDVFAVEFCDCLISFIL